MAERLGLLKRSTVRPYTTRLMAGGGGPLRSVGPPTRTKELRMGYNTTVFILNDQLGAIRRDPQVFVDDLHREIVGGPGFQVLGQTTVMPTAHADQFRLYATQGNSIEELSIRSAETVRLINGELFERALIERLVEQAESQLKELRTAIKKAEASHG